MIRLCDNNGYKTAATVIHTLADVVSKNGNLMLNVPLRGDGSMDEKERAVVDGIAGWMHINSEAIYATRPWKSFGEGPAIESAAPLSAQGFNEGKGKPFTAEDIRFTTKGKILYAILLGWPGNKNLLIKSVGEGTGKVHRVSLLGSNASIAFEQSANGLRVTLPDQPPCKDAFVLKISY
jgi:alpha-L-fucosidase